MHLLRPTLEGLSDVRPKSIKNHIYCLKRLDIPNETAGKCRYLAGEDEDKPAKRPSVSATSRKSRERGVKREQRGKAQSIAVVPKKRRIYHQK